MSSNLARERWDTEYQSGKYESDPPIQFVDKIIETLGEEGKRQVGLYIGCGNGRNYIPLLNSGLRIHGVDISPEAINQLLEREPLAKGKVFTGDFGDLTSARVFDYIVAIQVFQHGNKEAVDKLFKNTSMALKLGGRLFLRTNSVSTQIEYTHEIIEGDDIAGKTILYREGPKEGMYIHFFSDQELENIAHRNSFEIMLNPYEVTESRKSPQDGTWAQWETIWQKP